MHGRGPAYDNIFVERLWRSLKHKDVYLNGCATMGELLIIALNSTRTDSEEVRVDNEENAKIGAAPFGCVKSGAA